MQTGFFKVQLTQTVQRFTRPRANVFLLLSGALPRIYTQHNILLFTFEFHTGMEGFHTGKLQQKNLNADILYTNIVDTNIVDTNIVDTNSYYCIRSTNILDINSYYCISSKLQNRLHILKAELHFRQDTLSYSYKCNIT